MEKYNESQDFSSGSSELLIEGLTDDLNTPGYVNVLTSAQGYRASIKHNATMRNLIASVYSDNESGDEGDKSSSSDSDTSIGTDTLMGMRLEMNEINISNAREVCTLLQQARNGAQQSMDRLYSIDERIARIDRTSANIIGNFMQCGKCLGSWLLYVTGGTVGPCLLTAGSIRAAREDHVDEVAALILASGAAITVPSYYLYYKYFIASDNPNPRPVQTHNV